MVDFVALVTPPKLAGPDGKNANGDLYARTTSTIMVDGKIVPPFEIHGKVEDGEFKSLDGGPLSLVVTPEGVGLEVTVGLYQDGRGGKRDKYWVSRTVATPNQSTVTWDALIDMVPVVEGGDYVIPTWAAELDAKADLAIGAAATAVTAKNDAQEILATVDQKVADVPTPAELAATIDGRIGENVAGLVADNIDSPANALPPTAWVGITEPRVVGLGGKVWVGTTGENNELYMEEYSERGEGGPLWHRRYFVGHVPNTVAKDDHSNPAVLVRPGKPALVFIPPHSQDNLLRWRKSRVNIEQGIDFGPERRLELATNDLTSYAGVHVHNSTGNIFCLQRTGPTANFYAISKSVNWGDSFTHLGKFVSGLKQFYLNGAVEGDILRFVIVGHPTISDDHNVYYGEINLVTGAITKSDGTVLGNLDGTNLPIAHNAFTLIASPSAGEVLSEAVVSNGPIPQIAWTSANPNNIGPTGRYWYARRVNGSWSSNPVRYVGNQGVGASWGAAHFPVAPVAQGVLYITRKSGANWDVLRVASTDGGVTWVDDVIESAPITTTQAWPVDSLDGTTLGIKAVANQIRRYASYTDWDGSVRPFPTDRPVSRWQPLGDTADKPQPAPYSRLGLYLPGTNGNYITTPDTPALSPTTAIRFEIDVALDDWSTGVQQALIARYGFAGARSVKFFVNGDGKPGLSWSADGTVAVDLIPGSVLPFLDGERWQVRVDLIAAFTATNYLAKFWYRRPGETAWRHHSTTSVGSGALAIFDATEPWEIGARSGGTADRAKGAFYSASIMTLGGAVLAEWRADTATPKYRDAKGSIWTVNGTDSAFTSAPV